MAVVIDFELSNDQLDDYVRIMLMQKNYPSEIFKLLVDVTGIPKYCRNCQLELKDLFFFFSTWSNHLYCKKCIIDSGWFDHSASSIH